MANFSLLNSVDQSLIGEQKFCWPSKTVAVVESNAFEWIKVQMEFELDAIKSAWYRSASIRANSKFEYSMNMFDCLTGQCQCISHKRWIWKSKFQFTSLIYSDQAGGRQRSFESKVWIQLKTRLIRLILSCRSLRWQLPGKQSFNQFTAIV